MDSSNLPFVLVGGLFAVGIAMALTANRRAASAAMKQRVVHNLVFRGASRVGLLRCGVVCNDRDRLVHALRTAPPSFVRTLGSTDVRGVVAAAAQDLPLQDRESVLSARLAERGLRLEAFEVLVDKPFDDGCERLEAWVAPNCKYGASALVLSCTALELWLDAQSRLSMWVHKPNGQWTFERPLSLLKANKPLWVYKAGSGSATPEPKTFEALRTEG